MHPSLARPEPPLLRRDEQLLQNVVFTDGLWGSGKSLFTSIIGSFDRLEKPKVSEIFEHICIMHTLGHLSSNVAANLLQLHADLELYNMMISREVNLRPSDDTGPLKNSNSLRYIKRLFYPDGIAAIQRIQEEKPVLNIMIHQILQFVDVAFQAFGDRLRVVECLRHPVYMVEHWYHYVDGCVGKSNDFDLLLDYQGQAVPWFAHGWEERYLSLPLMDRVIHSMAHLMKQTDAAVERLSAADKNRILFIPFEKFVLDPWPYIRQLEPFLGCSITPATGKALKKQKCPRPTLTAGLGHAKYGWKKKTDTLSDRDDFIKRKRFITDSASPEALAILDEMSKEYEQRFGVNIR